MDETLLSRIEDAGINASAPSQQLWFDGWLLRLSAGKAKRARCINAVAVGRLPLQDKLRIAQRMYGNAGLPLIVRLTPFSQPARLDKELSARGFGLLDDTRVMVCPELATAQEVPLPPSVHWVELDAPSFAQAVGELRGSPPQQREAHAMRLAQSPVPYRGFAIRRDGDTSVLACGQFVVEGDLVGLYDVFTALEHRGQGLATLLCRRLLSLSMSYGASVGYLQVEADNASARRIYQRLGFADAYAYHYRLAPAA